MEGGTCTQTHTYNTQTQIQKPPHSNSAPPCQMVLAECVCRPVFGKWRSLGVGAKCWRAAGASVSGPSGCRTGWGSLAVVKTRSSAVPDTWEVETTPQREQSFIQNKDICLLFWISPGWNELKMVNCCRRIELTLDPFDRLVHRSAVWIVFRDRTLSAGGVEPVRQSGGKAATVWENIREKWEKKKRVQPMFLNLVVDQ